jgi:hypothetical protein
MRSGKAALLMPPFSFAHPVGRGVEIFAAAVKPAAGKIYRERRVAR